MDNNNNKSKSLNKMLKECRNENEKLGFEKMINIMCVLKKHINLRNKWNEGKR